MRTRTPLTLAIVALALGAAPAHAAPYDTIIQDDNVLVYGSPQDAANGLAIMSSLGAVDRPSAREFGRFARAMGRRYNGAFHPLHGPVAIPRVDVFELWNEANVPTFMQPQWRGGVPVAADQYRALVQAAYPAIKAVNRGAKVLIGVTAPGGFARGGATSPIAPIPFLRRLACVDARPRRAPDRGCRPLMRGPGRRLSQHPSAL